MKHVDVDSIVRSPFARLNFLSEFIGFGDEDWELLRDSVRYIAPQLPSLLDGLYAHLLEYDDTRAIFIGERGEVDPKYMSIRKEHLTEWFLMTAGAYEEQRKFADYLVSIGQVHTGRQGDPKRSVPPRYLVAMMAYIQAWLSEAMFKALPMEHGQAQRMTAAWNKMLMIQLEFFLRAAVNEWPRWDER